MASAPPPDGIPTSRPPQGGRLLCEVCAVGPCSAFGAHMGLREHICAPPGHSTPSFRRTPRCNLIANRCLRSLGLFGQHEIRSGIRPFAFQSILCYPIGCSGYAAVAGRADSAFLVIALGMLRRIADCWHFAPGSAIESDTWARKNNRGGGKQAQPSRWSISCRFARFLSSAQLNRMSPTRSIATVVGSGRRSAD